MTKASGKHKVRFSESRTRTARWSFGNMKKYTFLYIPEGSGTAKKFQIPKIVVLMSGVTIFVMLGAIAAMALSSSKIGIIIKDSQRLKAENASIRSEAAALVARLQDLQQNLSRVNQYSEEVKEVTKEVSSAGSAAPQDKRGNKNLKNRSSSGKDKPSARAVLPSLDPGIGPVSKDEHELAKSRGMLGQGFMPADVKVQNLEFKDIFSTLTDLKWTSSTQLGQLRTLLAELQQYRQKLSFTPTISPVNGYVSSLYGMRSSPINGEIKMHQGLDIAAPLGTPINAAASGVVQKTGFAEDYGNYVEIKHGLGVVSRYAHAKVILVKTGQRIEKGQVVGEVGMTGRTTGPHLHYELTINGRKVDPANFIRTF